jgi:hypothetical protein
MFSYRKLLTIFSGVFGVITLYFACIGFGSVLEFWIWRTCTPDIVDLYLIKPMYGSALVLTALALAIWWFYERKKIDYDQLYNNINYGSV